MRFLRSVAGYKLSDGKQMSSYTRRVIYYKRKVLEYKAAWNEPRLNVDNAELPTKIYQYETRGKQRLERPDKSGTHRKRHNGHTAQYLKMTVIIY